MKPNFNIQTEVRVADILALLIAGNTRYFICHNVAYLIREKLAQVPGYAEFSKLDIMYGANENDGLPYFFVITDSEGKERFTPKEFNLSYQIVGQLNSFHCRMTNEYPYCSDEVLNDVLLEYYTPRNNSPYFYWSKIARIEFIRAILKFDPDAVLNINI